jgi:putative lipoprotein
MYLSAGFFAILCIATLVLTSCAGPEVSAQDDSRDAAVRAIVNYRERIALPQDAIVELRLLDVSDPGGPAPLVAQSIIATDGRQVPIPVEVRYDTSGIRTDRRYALHASILSGDRTMFTTSAPYPVITGDAPVLVEMTLDWVSPEGRVHRSAENTKWRLLEIGGSPAIAGAGGRAPSLRFVPARRQVEGDSGCNPVSAPYEMRGRSVRIDEVTSPSRTCGDPVLLQQEGALLTLLAAARHWRVSVDTLVLSGAAGQTARFVAAPPD